MFNLLLDCFPMWLHSALVLQPSKVRFWGISKLTSVRVTSSSFFAIVVRSVSLAAFYKPEFRCNMASGPARRTVSGQLRLCHLLASEAPAAFMAPSPTRFPWAPGDSLVPGSISFLFPLLQSFPFPHILQGHWGRAWRSSNHPPTSCWGLRQDERQGLWGPSSENKLMAEMKQNDKCFFFLFSYS